MPENNTHQKSIDFAIPQDFDLPGELTLPAPRQLPKYVTDELRVKNALIQICLGVAAICCFGLARFMWIKILSLYFLPMGYLDWIGGGLVLIQMICLLRIKVIPPRLKLFQNGIPVPARIDEIVKQPEISINGVASRYAYYAAITLRLPGEYEPCRIQVQSQPLPDKNSYDCTYKVGDYVPALCMPMDSAVNVNLYGFLNVDITSGVIKKEQKVKTSLKEVAAVLGLLLLFPVFFFILFWNIYAYGRYSPIEFDYAQTWPAFVTGGVIGLLSMAWWWFCSRLKRKKVEAGNQAATEKGEATECYSDFWVGNSIESWLVRIIMVFGAPLVCALIVYCWAISLNAMMDDSEAQIKIADIDEMVMKTHSYIFREYVIKYHFENENKKHSFVTTPQHMMIFGDRKGAAVAIHKGAFGWKWVKVIAPL